MDEAPPTPERSDGERLPVAPGGEPHPAWPPWFGFAGFGVAVVCTAIAGVVVLGIAGVDPADEETAATTIVGTLLQGVFFVGVAVAMARSIAPPRLWHFGLRRAPLWRTVGWAALGMLAFYVLAAAYAVAVDPQAEQDVTDVLGAGEGKIGLIAAGIMVIVVAPFVEEVFFRGFFYRALRTRYSIALAAVVNGVIFGVIHFGFDGAEGLLILPPLALLGVIFCLVYERTKSLWAVIGMHAFNNTIAFAAATEDYDGWQVSVVVGPLMLAACVVLPRLLPAGPSPLPPIRARVGPEAQLSLPIQ